MLFAFPPGCSLCAFPVSQTFNRNYNALLFLPFSLLCLPLLPLRPPHIAFEIKSVDPCATHRQRACVHSCALGMPCKIHTSRRVVFVAATAFALCANNVSLILPTSDDEAPQKQTTPSRERETETRKGEKEGRGAITRTEKSECGRGRAGKKAANMPRGSR